MPYKSKTSITVTLLIQVAPRWRCEDHLDQRRVTAPIYLYMGKEKALCWDRLGVGLRDMFLTYSSIYHHLSKSNCEMVISVVFSNADG